MSPQREPADRPLVSLRALLGAVALMVTPGLLLAAVLADGHALVSLLVPWDSSMWRNTATVGVTAVMAVLAVVDGHG